MAMNIINLITMLIFSFLIVMEICSAIINEPFIPRWAWLIHLQLAFCFLFIMSDLARRSMGDK